MVLQEQIEKVTDPVRESLRRGEAPLGEQTPKSGRGIHRCLRGQNSTQELQAESSVTKVGARATRKDLVRVNRTPHEGGGSRDATRGTPRWLNPRNSLATPSVSPSQCGRLPV